MPDAVDLIIEPRQRDLGGFFVRRLLPFAKRRNVGPFVFFDHLGPAEMPPGQGFDVRSHPHIGLATVTWLFEGALEHRDSLGSQQTIRPAVIQLTAPPATVLRRSRLGSPCPNRTKNRNPPSGTILPRRYRRSTRTELRAC